MKWQSINEQNIQIEGYYPVLECYSIEEGLIPSAAYWNKTEWVDVTGHVVAYIPDKFNSVDEALTVAYENDPDDFK